MDDQTRIELEAAAFRSLVDHLRERTDVQNIDLMNLSGFCRNCLSRWYPGGRQRKRHRHGQEWCARNRVWHAVCGVAR